HAYLHAWCRSAEDVRRFRLDRIDAHSVLDEPAAVPPHARDHRDVPGAVFSSETGDLPVVTIRVSRAARWISEYYPCREVTVEADGRWLVSLRARDVEWAKRLVLSLGTDGEAVAPRQLREAVLADARAALSAY